MSIRNFNSVDWKEIKNLKALTLSFLAALEALVNVKVTPETFWQAPYMETTRSIVWLAKKKKKKSKTETVTADVWDRAPGTRSLGMAEAKDPGASLDWQFFVPSRNRITA